MYLKYDLQENINITLVKEKKPLRRNLKEYEMYQILYIMSWSMSSFQIQILNRFLEKFYTDTE